MTGGEDPPEEAELSSAAPVALALTPREVAVEERPPKKICQGLGSISSASSERHVWADLTDSLLHLIIALCSSVHDFLGVAITCRAWRAAVSSSPSIYNFTFPPLYVKTSVHNAHRSNRLSYYKWKFCDPAKTNFSLCCSAPQNTQYYVRYLGCSYGYLILSCGKQCLLVDVYTSTMVKPPKFRCRYHRQIHYGFLMAPLSSPNSGLLLFSRKSVLQWQVGANSWTEHPLGAEHIRQIVSFKGQMFAMDSHQKLNTISLAPHPHMREVPVVCAGLCNRPWLVVCGDMLLMVFIMVILQLSNPPQKKFFFRVVRLDLSAKPAKWVNVEKLENWALFVSTDTKSQTFSCMSPERWGGKSNCIYVPSKSEDPNEPWIAVELGRSMCGKTHPLSYILESKDIHLENFCVLPSLFYGVSQ
ncbi:unnamed protein product [Alopecurus aequalis]